MLDAKQKESIPQHEDKIRELDKWLTTLKSEIREFISLSSAVKTIFLQIDDFYHLDRADQPLVIDYIHRLCKDLPLYFKIATLRHVSALYADRGGQPIGAQERHDYQPINIDFTFANFRNTVDQNRKIFYEFGHLAAISMPDIDGLFKGEGFERLVLAGGGVPRDCLSLFLEVLQTVQPPSSDGRIGKDDVRILSRANFERTNRGIEAGFRGQRAKRSYPRDLCASPILRRRQSYQRSTGFGSHSPTEHKHKGSAIQVA